MFLQTGFLVFLALNAVFQATAAVDPNVQVFGTTVSPGFIRNEGERRPECPLNNPWSFNDGLSCCRTGKLLSNPVEDLLQTSHLSECRANDTIDCFDPVNRCKTNRIVEVKVMCPLTHPFAIGNSNFCCSRKFKNFDSAADPACDGTKLSSLDPVACCPMGDFIPCLNGGRKCSSNVTATERLLVAKQDISDGIKRVFTSSNYLSLNKENTSAELYSRLFQLEDFRGPDGKFHFKFCYPHLIDTSAPDSCFEFKQTSNPLDVTTATMAIEGLEMIQMLYSNEKSPQFGGLRSDSRNSAILDGDAGSNWWNSIVNVVLFSSDKLIPAADTSLERKVTDLAELYVIV